MPKWTAVEDQKILRGIFKFHDIKNSTALLEYLANEIGGDCTPNALSHRLSNIRNSGNPGGRSTTATPKKPSTPKTPGGRAKSIVKATPTSKRTEKAIASPVDLGSDDESVVSPLIARGKRTKRISSYALDESEEEDDGAPAVKRVKAEPEEYDDQSWPLGNPAPDDDFVDEV